MSYTTTRPPVKFVDAPPPGHSNKTIEHVEIANALKDRPGKWALIMSGVSTGHSGAIKKGRKAAFRPAGSFESVSRRIEGEDAKYDVYARYVGE